MGLDGKHLFLVGVWAGPGGGVNNPPQKKRSLGVPGICDIYVYIYI